MTIILPTYTQSKIFNYGVSAINAPSFWEEGYEGQGSIVAIIDSGCDMEHPELKDNIIGQFNFTNDDNGDFNIAIDYIGHGTHVSGIVASSNKKSIIGVAPKAKLLILKVIDRNGNGNYENLVKAIRFATNWRGPNNEKVNVINLSLGGRNDDLALKEAIDEVLLKDIFLVVAAGNYGDGFDSTDEILYPGFYEEVFQISAVDFFNKPTFFSNTNTNIDFLAPGESIYSTYLRGTYQSMSGTSMASPHVSGAIALLLNAFQSKKMRIDFNQIYQYLISNSLVLEGVSKKTQGNGVLKL